MNYNYAVINKNTGEQCSEDFCSLSEAYEYADKLNYQCGEALYTIVKVV